MKRFIALILIICICVFLTGSLVSIVPSSDGHGIMKLNVCGKTLHATGTHAPALTVHAYDLVYHSCNIETLICFDEHKYMAPPLTAIDRPPEVLSS